MSISSFGDISSIIEHWRADDVTTTGSVIETMVGQEGAFDFDNPNTYASNPILVSDVTPIGFPGVSMSISSRAQMNAITGLSLSTWSYVTVIRQDLVDAADRRFILWEDGVELIANTGSYRWLYAYGESVDGPTLATNDLITIINTKNGSTNESNIYWEGAVSGSNTGTPEVSIDATDISIGTFSRSQATIIAMEFFNDVLSSSERSDIFDYVDAEFINGATAGPTQNSIFFGMNF